MMFGGRSNIVEWSRGEPESRRGQPTDPGEVGRKFFEKWESSGCNKKAHRWYASFCLSLTFRFIFGTFRSGGVARFVLRIIPSNIISESNELNCMYPVWSNKEKESPLIPIFTIPRLIGVFSNRTLPFNIKNLTRPYIYTGNLIA